ncbi:hypothetical protein SAY86_028965 [Trapa natans]|uniref:Uncharacterized protein n=1 Tax=Trapa natans TaxID=22666 RepID=A0AAN7R941_TRANT|nr:hypothetical protein SAY86_028965 [Trapa natans]
MSTAAPPPLSRLPSPFLCCRPLRISPSAPKPSGIRRPPSSYPRIRAELDQNTVFYSSRTLRLLFTRPSCNVVAISVGVVSVAVGIGIPIFYETQIDNAILPGNGDGDGRAGRRRKGGLQLHQLRRRRISHLHNLPRLWDTTSISRPQVTIPPSQAGTPEDYSFGTETLMPSNHFMHREFKDDD